MAEAQGPCSGRKSMKDEGFEIPKQASGRYQHNGDNLLD
jgi:hypothetical protein